MPGTDPADPHAVAAPASLLRDAAATLDAAGLVAAWNASAEARFGVPAGDILGVRFNTLEAADDPALVRLPLADGRTLLIWPGATPGATTGAPPAPDQVLAAKARVLEFVAGPVQHDLANPLNALMLFGAMVRLEGGIPADMAGEIPAVADAAERTYRLARTMLELTRARPFTPQAVRLTTLADEVVELVGYLLADIDVVVEVPGTLPDVEADPTNLRLALVLVLANAIRALGGRRARGHLRVSAHVSEDGRAVDLVVVDSATPVGDDALAHLFDAIPPAAGGVRADGGLAAARQLVRRDGGDVRFEAGVDGSNRLVMTLPQMGRREEKPTHAVSRATSDAVTVLVCDDEDSIRALIIRALERAGLRAIEARSGPEALAVLEAEQVGLVLADNHMAGTTGTDLYLAALRTQPGLAQRFVLMSGDATDPDLLAFAREHRLRVLAKPFDLAVVPLIVRELAGT